MSTLYERVADQLAAQISTGVYDIGERLPSVRTLSQQMKVSVSTAQAALRKLEERDLIAVRDRSGHFVSRRPGVQPLRPSISQQPAVPVLVNKWAMARHALNAREDVLNLGRASPDVTLGTLKPLLRSLATLSRRTGARAMEYADLRGSDELRQQIARRARDAGLALLPEDFLVTNGCQESLICCLRAVTKPGDIVAVESPTYYGMLQSLEALGLKALEITTSPDTGIDLDALQAAMNDWPVRAILVTPTLCNPTGGTMPDTHKRCLARLANECCIPVIEDDVYGDLTDADTRPAALKAYDTDGWVLYCSSVSKTLAPGIRIGWCAPGRFFSEVERQKYVSSMHTATLTQLALAEYMARGDYNRHLRAALKLYRQRRLRMIDRVQQCFPDDTRISSPAGGLLLWIELPDRCSATTLTAQAMRQHVGIAPGPMFSSTERYANCIRINFARQMDQRISDAVHTIGMLAESHRFEDP